MLQPQRHGCLNFYSFLSRHCNTDSIKLHTLGIELTKYPVIILEFRKFLEHFSKCRTFQSTVSFKSHLVPSYSVVNCWVTHCSYLSISYICQLTIETANLSELNIPPDIPHQPRNSQGQRACFGYLPVTDHAHTKSPARC